MLESKQIQKLTIKLKTPERENNNKNEICGIQLKQGLERSLKH